MTRRIAADICVIGAGSAGLSFAAGAAQLGRKVVLVEKGEMGGDCLNYGCVPSKALIAAAARAHAARSSARFGVRADPAIDFGAVMDHVHGAIAAIAPHDSQERFEGFGVTVIRAAGVFTGQRTLAAGDAVVTAKRFIIATGSRAAIPPIPGLPETPYFTNETLFANRTLPEHLLILGGGPIGCEMAQAFRRLGARVSIFEAQRLLGREDPEAAEIVRASLRADGVALHEDARVARVSGKAGAIELHLADGATIPGSHLLIAAGRSASLEGLALDKADVETNAAGIVVDAGLRTSNPRIFAIGDAAGGAQFTHLAGDHASTAVRRILFKMPARRRDALAPRVTFTDPEIAAVGLGEDEALKMHQGARSVRWSFENNDRAQAEGATEGFAKAVADRKGRLLGACVVGKGAGEVIQLFSFALANGLTMKAFTAYIAPYPTRGEIAKRLGGQWYAPALFSPRGKALVRLLATFD